MKFRPQQPLAGAIRIDPQPEAADLSAFEFTTDLLKCLPGTLARQYEAIPISLQAGTLWVAVAQDTPLERMAAFQAALNRPVRFFLVNPEVLRVLLVRFYGANDAGIRGPGASAPFP